MNLGIIAFHIIYMPDLWIIRNDTNILTNIDRIFEIIIPDDPN